MGGSEMSEWGWFIFVVAGDFFGDFFLFFSSLLGMRWMFVHGMCSCGILGRRWMDRLYKLRPIRTYLQVNAAMFLKKSRESFDHQSSLFFFFFCEGFSYSFLLVVRILLWWGGHRSHPINSIP